MTKKKVLFEHRKIRWGKELLGTLQMALIVIATGFIFGWDHQAWKRVLALLLIISATHSISILNREQQPNMESSPTHVKFWHATHFLLGIIGSIWLYATTGPVLATVLNLLFWMIFLPLHSLVENKEREEILEAQETEV